MAIVVRATGDEGGQRPQRLVGPVQQIQGHRLLVVVLAIGGNSAGLDQGVQGLAVLPGAQPRHALVVAQGRTGCQPGAALLLHPVDLLQRLITAPQPQQQTGRSVGGQRVAVGQGEADQRVLQGDLVQPVAVDALEGG